MNSKEFIDSGILELYVMGIATTRQADEVEKMLVESDEIRSAANDIQKTLETYAQAHAIAPASTIKPFLLATIDYSERIKNGEEPSFPPVINETSKIIDYTQWINRNDMILPDNFKDFHAKIIGYTPEIVTAIVWIRNMAPHEVHDDEFEKFLILEGTCDITIGDKVHKMASGDSLSIPLHIDHFVTVTSDIPCKVILQRIAA
jgi:mannose-6-phosphate isomerase-like protein (cupin superfamily)